MNTKKMSREKVEWAWSKWNEGYRLVDIAEVLGVCYRTVWRHMSILQDEGRQKVFSWHKNRELKPLKYGE